MTQEIEQVESETVAISPVKQAYADGLRKLADWVEAHHQDFTFTQDVTVNLWAFSKEDFAKKARYFGAADKVVDETYFMLRKDFGGGVRIDLNSHREVICERVKVGEEVIPERVIPAMPEQVVPAQVIEKYEYRCPDSILGGAA